MKLPEWFKWLRLALWLAIIAFFSWLLSQRVTHILDGTATNTDIMILLIWVALLTAVIFQEVDFFGVRLRREIENVKNEFEKQIVSLKSEIKQNQTVNVYPPPSPDSQLPEIRRLAEATLKGELEKLVVKQTPTPDATVPNDVLNLFTVRYSIESELKRLTDLCWQSEDKTFYPRTVIQKLEFLVKMNVIHPNLARILKEMYAQSSAAVHGEQISEQATQWIMHDAASTVQVLKGIPPQPAQATKVQR
jgi:hypothetical protein